MTYHPIFSVLTDGEGHFLGIQVCTCEPTKEGDNEECPVHA